MSKLKTHRGAAKRFKKTGGKKSGIGFKHRQSFRNHISTKKPSKRMRQLRHMKVVNASDVASIKQMLPH